MSAERELFGVAASPGLAVGLVRHWAAAIAVDWSPIPQSERARAVIEASAALEAAAAELAGVAAGLGKVDAEIVETGVLMASDPTLLAAVERTIPDDGLSATAAILAATQEQAKQAQFSATPGRSASTRPARRRQRGTEPGNWRRQRAASRRSPRTACTSESSPTRPVRWR